MRASDRYTSAMGKPSKPHSRLLGITLLVSILTAGCSPQAADTRLTVFAAASTTDVVTILTAELDARTSFGPSSALARQVLDGAPADVFISANEAWVDELERAGATQGAPIRIANNSIVCIALAGSALVEQGVANVRDLLAKLPEQDLIAIADEGVPVGEYTRQSLNASGQWRALSSRLVGQNDARDCLRAVQSGQATAGFVYATDARFDGVEVLFELDPASHSPVEVWAVATSPEPEAGAFLQRLLAPDAQRVLSEAGFTVLDTLQ